MAIKINSEHLDQLDHVPEALLMATPESLHSVLPKPTLIHLQGKQQAPVFVSVLLHGNETTGFYAVQELLKRYFDKELPRAMSIFFGNIDAARSGLRRLDGQPDFNRVWPGTPLETSPESLMMAEIIHTMQDKNVFVSIDVHNNTGLNPHYACVNKLDDKFLQLATLFGRFVVYFTRPQGVQSSAFAELCPAVTLECGRPGQQYGVEHAVEFLNSALHLAEFPAHSVHHQDIDLYHTVALVKIKDGIRFSFSQQDAQLLLEPDLEKLNFTDVSANTTIGTVNNLDDLPLLASDENGHDVSERYFNIVDGRLVIRRATMPSMLTLDERIIEQDCLCYLMERLAI
ncbi:peptidase M14 [Methylophaga sp. 42_8_T64]|nr:peptidase M14 [Methylophaga sp. 42_8_T64]